MPWIDRLKKAPQSLVRDLLQRQKDSLLTDNKFHQERSVLSCKFVPTVRWNLSDERWRIEKILRDLTPPHLQSLMAICPSGELLNDVT